MAKHRYSTEHVAGFVLTDHETTPHIITRPLLQAWPVDFPFTDRFSYGVIDPITLTLAGRIRDGRLEPNAHLLPSHVFVICPLRAEIAGLSQPQRQA